MVKKRLKQKKTDDKKKEVKRTNIGRKDSIRVQNLVPNIRSIPENCKHLVNIDDVLYVVPGDGCCGPNCAAAFLFHDEKYGPNLRIYGSRRTYIVFERFS